MERTFYLMKIREYMCLRDISDNGFCVRDSSHARYRYFMRSRMAVRHIFSQFCRSAPICGWLSCIDTAAMCIDVMEYQYLVPVCGQNLSCLILPVQSLLFLLAALIVLIYAPIEDSHKKLYDYEIQKYWRYSLIILGIYSIIYVFLWMNEKGNYAQCIVIGNVMVMMVMIMSMPWRKLNHIFGRKKKSSQ